MKRIVGAVAMIAIVGAALLFTTRASAQNRVAPGTFILEGPGSAIGVTVRDLSSQEAAGDAARGGAVIDGVQSGTPAAQAGLTAGDVVLEFDGERVRSARQFTRLVRETPPGRVVQVTVLRGGSRQTISVTPEARTARGLVPDGLQDRIERSLERLPRNFDFDFDFDFPRDPARILSRGRLGASVAPLTAQLAEYFGVKEGVLVESVQADSPASRAGLRAGDVITSIGGNAVRSPADVTRALRGLEPNATIEMRVMRDRKETTLTVTAPDRPRPRGARGVTA